MYIFKLTWALGLSNLVSYLNHKSVPSSHYFKSNGRTSSSVALWKISKFLGIKLFGGGKSNFFLSVDSEGFFILFKICSEKGAISYLVSYHSSTSYTIPSKDFDFKKILRDLGSQRVFENYLI